MLSVDNRIRNLIHQVVKNQKFEYFIIFCIILSSVILTLDNPLDDPDSTYKSYLKGLDYSVTTVFGIEAFLKIIAFGFIINGRTSYLRSLSNFLGIFIIYFSINFLSKLRFCYYCLSYFEYIFRWAK